MLRTGQASLPPLYWVGIIVTSPYRWLNQYTERQVSYFRGQRSNKELNQIPKPCMFVHRTDDRKREHSFFFFCLFRATPMAYRSSQARAWIGAVPLAYTTATATPNQSCICDLHHSSWQCCIFNPLSKARDQTCVLMDISQIRFHWATTGTPENTHFLNSIPPN